MSLITRIFYLLRMSTRRLVAEDTVTGAPTNLPPGALVYSSEDNKLYVGKADGTIGLLGSGGAGGAGGQTNPRIVSRTTDEEQTIVTDADACEIVDALLVENATLANPTNPVDGKTIRWRLTQGSGGNKSVTLGDQFSLPTSHVGATLPFSTNAGETDLLAATYRAAATKWEIIAFVPGYTS